MRVLTYFALMLCAASMTARAQLAPMGEHHAQPSTLGGGVGYATSVPLDLPASRGGLPVPVSLVTSGLQFGAAGRGWDVPLSYIREDSSLAHRRPTAGAPGRAPVSRNEVVLTLNGSTVRLVPDGQLWVPQDNGGAIRAYKEAGYWQVFDGEGRTYIFDRHPLLPTLWLLGRISGASGASGAYVDLEYRVAKSQDMLEIDLERVRYNHSASGVAKHEILLEYNPNRLHGTTAPPTYVKPYSLTVVGDENHMRRHTLKSIEVRSRENPSDDDDKLKRVRKYELTYERDADTLLPRLQAVHLAGRTDVPPSEGPSSLLVARYSYGSATVPGSVSNAPRRLRWIKARTLSRPEGAPEQLASEERSPSGVMVNKTMLLDVDGDARADQVFFRGDALMLSRQRADGSGGTFFERPSARSYFGDGALSPASHLGAQSTVPMPARYRNWKTDSRNHTWRTLRDVNGDGTPDLIVANELPGAWVYYISQPSPTQRRWTRVPVDVTHLAAMLQNLGHSPYFGQSGTSYLPLQRQTTYQLFSESGTQWFSLVTATEWQLADVNGDGGVDLMMTSSPTSAPWTNSMDVTPGGKVLVSYVTGVTNLAPSSEPVVFAHSNQGINLWWSDSSRTLNCNQDGDCSPVPYRPQPQVAGGTFFDDYNGDGLLDVRRSNESRIYLGNGRTVTSVFMNAGGYPEWFENTRDRDCPGSGFSTRSVNALRDVTGDGLPDLIQGKYVRVSNGVEFIYMDSETSTVREVDIDSPSFDVSSGASRCDGSFAGTYAGLYEMDGDGRLDLVKSTNGQLEIYHLQGSDGLRAHSAGLLRKIENGHGGRIEIVYGSAKDDARTPHQYPGAEIVVRGVKTYQSDRLVTEKEFSYGNPLYGYDPMRSGFRAFGYGRTVEWALTDRENRVPGQGEAVATITDTIPLNVNTSTDAMRLESVLVAGRVSSVRTLAGQLPTSGELLAADVLSDPRRIRLESYAYSTRSWLATGSEPGCLFVDKPYASGPSHGEPFSATLLDTCRSRGFAFTRTNTVTRSDSVNRQHHAVASTTIDAVDDFGQPTRVYRRNDERLDSDDVCVITTFAQPITDFPRVVSAVSETRIGRPRQGSCSSYDVLSRERTDYDELSNGQVGLRGLPTGKTLERRHAETGALLDTIRVFDAKYDSRGNLISVVANSGDGRTRTSSFSDPDPFGLLFTKTSLTATGAMPQSSKVVLDPVSMLALSSTNVEGLTSGVDHDRFGRVVNTWIMPPGSEKGAMSYTRYLGFEGIGADPEGRRIVHKRFDNPVPVAGVGLAVGHTSTTHLDEFGRVEMTTVSLGTDYSDSLSSVSLYDELGRVAFQSDPFPTAEDASQAYGTTHFYNPDGSPKCTIRGAGAQSFAESSSSALERYPTCFRRWFDNGKEYVATQTADALSSDLPQTGVQQVVTMSAIGRILSHEVAQGATLLERTTFGYNSLGHRTSQLRVKVGGAPGEGVETRFVHDSLGQVLSVSEPATLTRSNTYSRWGELIRSSTPASTAPPEPARETISVYDGLGRLIHTEERNGNVVDAATVYDYVYDIGESIHPKQPASYPLGRLTKASSPTSSAYFGYDALGRLTARATRDSSGQVYVETAQFDADGMPTRLGMALPDTGHALETVDYAYDSARRLVSAQSHDGQRLFRVDNYDVFGRPLEARIGGGDSGLGALYLAEHQPSGRRLPISVDIVMPNGNSRGLNFGAFDAIGREIQRSEHKNLQAQQYSTRVYDALGRLTESRSLPGRRHTFSYDPLGNLLLRHEDDNDAADVTSTYRSDHADRLCRVYTGADQSEFTNYTIANAQNGSNGAVFLESSIVLGAGSNSQLTIKLQIMGGQYGSYVAKLIAPDNSSIALGSFAAPTVYTDATFNVDVTGKPSAGIWRLHVDVLPSPDMDTVPALNFWRIARPTGCNVVHDAVGNIVQYPAANGIRTLTYYASGRIKSVSDANGARANFRYGAMGEVEELDILGATETRQDRRFGSVEKRDVGSSSVLVRHFPAGGVDALKHGAGTNWSLTIGEARGNRFVLDGGGNIIQDVDYSAFGQPKSTGVASLGALHSRDQWNGGEFLAAFGLSHLGARLYDPTLGRFLSPDPVTQPTNAYSFANNDPINGSDPTGLCTLFPGAEPADCANYAAMEARRDMYRYARMYIQNGGAAPASHAAINLARSESSASAGMPMPKQMGSRYAGGFSFTRVQCEMGSAGCINDDARAPSYLEILQDESAPTAGRINALLEVNAELNGGRGLFGDLLGESGALDAMGPRTLPRVGGALPKARSARDIERDSPAGADDSWGNHMLGNVLTFSRLTTDLDVKNAVFRAIDHGATEVHVASGAHGDFGRGGLGITGRTDNALFLTQDDFTLEFAAAFHPEVSLRLYDITEPAQYDAYRTQRSRAREGESGVYAVDGFCFGACIFSGPGDPTFPTGPVDSGR